MNGYIKSLLCLLLASIPLAYGMEKKIDKEEKNKHEACSVDDTFDQVNSLFIAKKYQEAYPLLKNLYANASSFYAHCFVGLMLGDCYFQKLCTTDETYKQALAYYLEIYNNENHPKTFRAMVIHRLAHVYFHRGMGQEQNYVEAFKYFYQAYQLLINDDKPEQKSDKRCFDALKDSLLNMSFMCFFGLGVKKDHKKANEYVSKLYTIANNEGLTLCLFGFKHLYDRTGEQNYAKAHNFASIGYNILPVRMIYHISGVAALTLANIYTYGFGQQKDYEKALKYCKKAYDLCDGHDVVRQQTEPIFYDIKKGLVDQANKLLRQKDKKQIAEVKKVIHSAHSIENINTILFDFAALDNQLKQMQVELDVQEQKEQKEQKEQAFSEAKALADSREKEALRQEQKRSRELILQLLNTFDIQLQSYSDTQLQNTFDGALALLDRAKTLAEAISDVALSKEIGDKRTQLYKQKNDIKLRQFSLQNADNKKDNNDIEKLQIQGGYTLIDVDKVYPTLTDTTKNTVKERLSQLSKDPYSVSGAIKIVAVNSADLWRVKAGKNYRIIYTILPRKSVAILCISNRKDCYGNVQLIKQRAMEIQREIKE